MLGNLDDIFSGKKTWVLDDNEEAAGDNIPAEKATTIKKKRNLKSKCKSEILMAKGTEKNKLNNRNIEIKIGENKTERIVTNKEKLNKKLENINISDKLKSISSKVRQIDNGEPKIKSVTLSSINANTPANKLNNKITKPKIIQKCNLVTQNKLVSQKSIALKEKKVPDLDSSHIKPSSKKKRSSKVISGNKLKGGPAKVINKLVGSNKQMYADSLNKMLVGLKEGSLRNQYNDKDKRVMVKKVKKYLKSHARSQKKAAKKLNKKVKKEEPIKRKSKKTKRGKK